MRIIPHPWVNITCSSLHKLSLRARLLSHGNRFVGLNFKDEKVVEETNRPKLRCKRIVLYIENIPVLNYRLKEE